LSPALLVPGGTVEQMAISYILFLTSSSFALNVLKWYGPRKYSTVTRNGRDRNSLSRLSRRYEKAARNLAMHSHRTGTAEMKKAFELTFSNGSTAHAIQVDREADLSAALHELDFHRSFRTLVLVGGAGGLGKAELDRLRPLFIEVLAPLVATLGAAVVDGGTDAGVMRLMGHARAETNATFALVGVVAIGMVTLPNTQLPALDTALLESHHTHFVLVPGTQWGDESPWLSRVAGTLAQEAPSVTVLVNGGETAWQDVLQSVKARRPVIVVGGSGRTADKLAGTLRGKIADERARELSASGLLRAVDLKASADTLIRTIEQSLLLNDRGA
jgi:hypothetical protein